MDKENLLIKIMELDFMSIDLQLYLDTHPNDKTCLKKYNDIIAQSDELKKDYEKNIGPLTSFRTIQKEEYKWINEPWPNQMQLNFEVKKGEL